MVVRPNRAVLKLDAFLPYRLSVLSQKVIQSIAEVYTRAHRLSTPDWKVMSLLANHGPILPAEIRRFGTLDKAAISRALKRLTHRGLVVRKKRPQDGRTFEVTLSDSGWRLYGDIVPEAKRKEEAILEGLSDSERAELLRLLGKLDQFYGNRRL